MPERIRLTVLGGSALATPLLFESLARQGAGAAYEAVLVGRNPDTLGRVTALSQDLLSRHPQADIRVRSTTDAARGLEGAHLVLNQVRVGGLEGRLFDETFPRAFGVPGEETVGPGGFSSALRGIPVALELARAIRSQAPDATVVNLTNPSSLIQYALRRYAGLRVVGTCDAPVSLMDMIARALEAPRDALAFELGGMHHFTWVTAVRQEGADRMPDLLDRLERMPRLGVDPECVRALGAIPSPYLRFVFHADRVLAATEGRAPRAQQLIELNRRLLEAARRWQPGEPADWLRLRGAAWYDKIVTPALLALAERRPAALVLSVDNRGAFPFLPDDAVVEGLVAVHDGKAGRAAPVSFPPDVQALVQRNQAYESMAVQAIVERDRGLALRALMSNPLVHDFNQARGVLAAVWPDEPRPAVRIERPAGTPVAPPLRLPTLSYGERLLESFTLPEGSFALITMEEPWELARSRLALPPAAVAFVRELDAYGLEALERALPEVEAVVALGGGTSTDAAKYVAWRRRLPVDVFPSITSVDAAVTTSIAARAAGIVTYIGHIVPRRVFVDTDLIRAAPPRLNRSGVGDILCAHTALWDWGHARDRGQEGFDDEAARAMQAWLGRIRAEAESIRQVTPDGIRLIMEAFADISMICRVYGSSRPQEGSEHTFAYNAEYLTGRGFLHGELVALGAFVMASLQDNAPEWLEEAYRATGLLWQPRDLGLTRAEFVHVVKTLNEYHKNFGRRFSILDTHTLDQAFGERLAERLTF